MTQLGANKPKRKPPVPENLVSTEEWMDSLSSEEEQNSNSNNSPPVSPFLASERENGADSKEVEVEGSPRTDQSSNEQSNTTNDSHSNTINDSHSNTINDSHSNTTNDSHSPPSSTLPNLNPLPPSSTQPQGFGSPKKTTPQQQIKEEKGELENKGKEVEFENEKESAKKEEKESKTEKLEDDKEGKEGKEGKEREERKEGKEGKEGKKKKEGEGKKSKTKFKYSITPAEELDPPVNPRLQNLKMSVNSSKTPKKALLASKDVGDFSATEIHTMLARISRKLEKEDYFRSFLPIEQSVFHRLCGTGVIFCVLLDKFIPNSIFHSKRAIIWNPLSEDEKVLLSSPLFFYPFLSFNPFLRICSIFSFGSKERRNWRRVVAVTILLLF